ncbi:MAG: NADH-dependent butanol dehydrogenase A [Alphaproteobacteria bacterium ADurb.Bin438]|nr:MAG: NADH-dependent butanol dehydrogenase A [Alphaproteobacteria bacterium ADurb.Bin438]
MENFELCLPTKMIFGKGEENKVGEHIKPYADKILLHFGGGSVKRSGLYERVINSLKEAGIEIFELGGVKANPTLPLVYEGIKICRENDIKFILAVGGGSVIDSAKAIGVGTLYDGDVWDFFARKAVPTKSLQIATILTIPAAGSEGSANSVITNEETKVKTGIKCQASRPVFSILNPELCFTLPREQMAYGVCDMICHIHERYFTNSLHTDVTDGLCEATLKTIIRNAKILVKDYRNYNAWAEIMWSGTIAHNGMLGVGRVEDWASHMIEHQLSAFYNIAHGEGLAIINPAWMRYVFKDNIKMFVQYAINVHGVDSSLRDEEALALEGIRRYEKFLNEIGLKTKLNEIGIKDEDFEEMSKKATSFGEIGNFKKLNADDVKEIYKLAL